MQTKPDQLTIYNFNEGDIDIVLDNLLTLKAYLYQGFLYYGRGTLIRRGVSSYDLEGHCWRRRVGGQWKRKRGRRGNQGMCPTISPTCAMLEGWSVAGEVNGEEWEGGMS